MYLLGIKFPCGFTARWAIKQLETTTEIGKNWNFKAKFEVDHLGIPIVEIHERGVERVQYNLITGKRQQIHTGRPSFNSF